MGETLAGRQAFATMLQRKAARIVMFDIGWVGGISEAKKIASLAETHDVPIAPHDCTGPVVLTAGTALSIERAQRAPPGDRPGLLHRLVRRHRHGAARRGRRPDHAAAGDRVWGPPCAPICSAVRTRTCA